MSIVASESGKAFDPQVVAILLRRHKELEQLARIHTADQDQTVNEIFRKWNVAWPLPPDFASAADDKTNADLRQDWRFRQSRLPARGRKFNY